MSQSLVLIDGNSLINRAFYAIGMLNARDGTPTNALYGFVNMLVKLIQTEQPDSLAVVFDRHAPTFRHRMYDQYKGTRKGMPEDLACQMPLLKELLTLMDIRFYEIDGYEADDIIGTIASHSDRPTVIVTGDRDALQLVSDRVTVRLTLRGLSQTADFTVPAFREEYGFDPVKLIDLKALMGDSSDNIPGVKGVGEKTAKDLIVRYGSLDGVYDHLDEIKGALHDKLANDKESAYLSYRLATIDTQVPIEYSIDQMTYQFPFAPQVRAKFEAYSFKGLSAKEALFASSDSEQEARPSVQAECVKLTSTDFGALDFNKPFALFVASDAVHVAFDARTDYSVRLGGDLIDPGITLDEAMRMIPQLSDDRIPKTLFGIKALRRLLAPYGIEIEGADFDVQLAQYVIDCNQENDSLGAVLSHYGIGQDGYEAAQAAGLLCLRERMEPLLQPFSEVFYQIEMPMERVLFEMEQTGFLLDTAALEESGRVLSEELDLQEKKIIDLAGQSFNVNSPKQIGQILFDKLGLDAGKKTKTKAYSTSAEVLENLRGEPIVDALLRYRFISKLYHTYIEGISKLLGSDHVIHTIFKQTVTTTGRLSSTEPNLQNIPIREEEGRVLRKMFVARPGCILVSADYSQIELRLLTHFSQETAMIEAYRAGADIHTTTASHVFGVPESEVTSKMRRDAKAVNFGVIYGISDFGLSKNLGISVAQARKYILGYFMRYPRIKEYLDGTVELARKNGCLSTLTGRVRKFENIHSSNFQLRSFNERAAKNFPLQGTAADLIKIAMLRVSAALKKQVPTAHLLLQVHDELIVECLEQDADRVAEILKSEMEHAMSLSIPLVAEVARGKTWFELK